MVKSVFRGGKKWSVDYVGSRRGAVSWADGARYTGLNARVIPRGRGCAVIVRRGGRSVHLHKNIKYRDSKIVEKAIRHYLR